MNLRPRHLPLIAGSTLLGLVFFGLVLGATVGKESIYKYLNVFAEVYSLVRGNYVDPVDVTSLVEGAYRGMVSGLGPFSGYVGKDAFVAIQRDPVGGPADSGLEVLKGPGGAVIVAVRAGSDAEKAGLRPGDLIWGIDGTPTRQLCLLQMRRSQRGPDGSSVHVLVYHPKTQKREDLTLHKTLPSGAAFEARLIEGKVVYLRLFNLERVEKETLKASLAPLRQKGATRMLLDLRGCAAGSVEDAVRVAGLFVPPGAIVFVHDRAGGRVAKASTSSTIWTLPITVLGNWGCAGGAEIVAAALRSRLKAQIVGETTYGLGSNQEFVPLPSGDGLILSSGKLVSPGGESWNKTGLKPDKEIPSTPEERAGLEPDNQLQKALELLRPPAAAPAAKAA